MMTDREIDASIAVARFGKKGEGMELQYASLPTHYDDCAPGTYWEIRASGMTLRTAPVYSQAERTAFLEESTK